MKQQIKMEIIFKNFADSGYDIAHQLSGKFYGIHPADEPFYEELLLLRKNIKPVFAGDSLIELQELLIGSKQTLHKLINLPEKTQGMFFDGSRTLDFIEMKLKQLIEASNIPKSIADGHFYSPIPSLAEIKKFHAQNFIGIQRKLAAIPFNEEVQQYYLQILRDEYKTMPLFPENKTTEDRYYYNNGHFSYFDAFVLQSFIRHFKPQKIIETGSGFSSCVLLDTNDKYFNPKIDITHIEPYPELLNQLITDEHEKNNVIVKCLQDVDLDIFETLDKGDILFIDTSHVSKIGSDVNHYLFEIFPRLQEGVIIHIHDIGLSFEYELDHMLQGRAWNESYTLRAFLMYNSSFNIIFWNPFMLHFYPEIFHQDLPLCASHPGGSIWLIKSR